VLSGVRRSRSRRVRLVAAALVLVVLAAACDALPGDFPGDRKADLFYLNDQTGVGYTTGSTTPLFTGQPDDLPVPGDYNGDHGWEPTVLRGTTWISTALTDPIVYAPAGMPAGPPGTPAIAGWAPATVIPVPGDYDGTGKTIPAYYDQVDASWWIMGHPNPVQFGEPPTTGGTDGYDLPVPADYDGDGKTDIAVFRPTDHSFHYLSSKTGQEVVVTPSVPAGYPAFMPVPADYDGVGHAEAAATDGAGENWYVAGHTDPIATFPVFESFPTDSTLPAPADYNGDGKAEPALVDTTNGAWWFLGQPQPRQTGFQPVPYVPAVFPAAVLMNVVRLSLFEQCLYHGSPPC
jgi:hypothetical protein